jgi:hypothetical protein
MTDRTASESDLRTVLPLVVLVQFRLLIFRPPSWNRDPTAIELEIIMGVHGESLFNVVIKGIQTRIMAASSTESYQRLSEMKRKSSQRKECIQKQAQHMQHMPQQSVMSDILELGIEMR